MREEDFANALGEIYAYLVRVAIEYVPVDGGDDVVQQAAIVALLRLNGFEPGTDFRAWMAAIVRGVARNDRRSRLRRRARHREWARAHAARHGDIPHRPLAIETRTLDRVTADLSELEWTCLRLRVVRERKYTEIADALQIPEGTARSAVHRARHRLGRRLHAR